MRISILWKSRVITGADTQHGAALTRAQILEIFGADLAARGADAPLGKDIDDATVDLVHRTYHHPVPTP